MKTMLSRVFLISILLFFIGEPIFAVQQTITLNPGWNAVYLEVEPDDGNPDTTNDTRWERIISGMPILAVRAWKGVQDKIEFIENPGDISEPSVSNWHAYYPPGSPVEFLTSFWEAHAKKSYLIQLDGSTAVDLIIEGRPVLPDITWKPDSFNFVGFHLEPGNEPLFKQFFEIDPALDNQEIYFLNTLTGTWDKVLDAETTFMRSGEAYWIYCKGASNFQGPLEILDNPLESLDFGETVTKRIVKIKNYSPLIHQGIPEDIVSDATIQVSGTGSLPLSYWVDPPSDKAGWNSLSGPAFIGEESQQYTNLQLSVRRRDMADTFKDTVTITNGQGFRLQLPVSASKPDTPAGLWVGYASIKKVSQAYDKVDPLALRNTGKEFQIRLLVHLDAEGKASLLSQVIQMWKPGSTKYNDEYGGYIVVDPGEYALFTDHSLIPPNYKGADLVNGQTVGKRISSVNFGFDGIKNMSGIFDDTLELKADNAIVIGYDSPLNPFKHAYHPDHDNYNRYYDPDKLGEGVEVFEIKRELELQFTTEDPEVPSSIASTNWGYSEVGGIYRETITGLHKNQIRAEGVFRLYHISKVATLNPAE